MVKACGWRRRNKCTPRHIERQTERYIYRERERQRERERESEGGERDRERERESKKKTDQESAQTPWSANQPQ